MRTSALAVALVAAALAGFPAPAAAVGQRDVTVASYNIFHAGLVGGDVSRIAAVVRSTGADIVALQEVDRSWSRSGSVDQAAALARQLGMRAYFAPNLNCTSRDNGGDGFCQYGTAILSRYPFVAGSSRQYALPSRAGAEPRGLAKITVNVAGRQLDVFNTHIYHESAVGRPQLAAVRARVARLRRPFVLAGDFNTLPHSSQMVSLRRVIRDAAIEAGRPYLRTTNPPPGVRIDYILLPRPPFNGLRRPIQALSARVPYATASDHRPFVARLRIPAD